MRKPETSSAQHELCTDQMANHSLIGILVSAKLIPNLDL